MSYHLEHMVEQRIQNCVPHWGQCPGLSLQRMGSVVLDVGNAVMDTTEIHVFLAETVVR